MLIPDIGWYGESVRLGNRRFSVGLFEGLQNLFRGISKGRSDDSDTLPVVSSVGLDESDGAGGYDLESAHRTDRRMPESTIAKTVAQSG